MNISGFLVFEANCGDLTSVENGEVSQTYPDGGVATYTCNPGYDIVSGDGQRTCQDNGQWTGTEPACMRMYQISTMKHPYIIKLI